MQNTLNLNVSEDARLLNQLMIEADTKNIEIRRFKFKSDNIRGLYVDGVITINSSVTTVAETTCVLAEEIGHHETSIGDILDQRSLQNRKQELRAREWAYQRLIPLERLIDVYHARVKGRYEIAEYLGVTEDFLQASIDRYTEKYGLFKRVDNYIIYFSPLGVAEIF